MSAVSNTVVTAMLACCVPNTPVFQNVRPHERLTEQIFLNDFNTCITTSVEDAKNSLNAFVKLPQTNGRIALTPGVRIKILGMSR